MGVTLIAGCGDKGQPKSRSEGPAKSSQTIETKPADKGGSLSGPSPPSHVAPRNDPALVKAAGKGDFNEIQRLLAQGSDVNSKTSGGTTALMEASRIGNIEIVQLLLSKGADANEANQFDQTAMGFALDKGHKEIRELLLKHGAANKTRQEVLESREKKERLSKELREVCYYGKELWEAQSLIRRGADVNGPDEKGETPLMIGCAMKGRPDVVEYLIEKGALIEQKDKEGRTALIHGAMAHTLFNLGHETDRKMKVLLDRGANFNAVDKTGKTALIHSSKEPKPGCVKVLLDKGAPVNTRDNEGKTALWYVNQINCGRSIKCHEERKQVIDLLRSHGATE
jgi:ankyrin repeat protein